jgi:hypothetical protein
MVQFEDLTIVRKQARLDDLQDLRNLAWEQLRLLLEMGCVIDGRTGEVRQVPVDPRLFKAAADTIIKILRTVDETTGQLPQRVEGLDERWTRPVLGLGGGRGIDYAALARLAAERKAEWEAAAPEREAAEREREAERRTRKESLNRLLTSVGVDEQSSERRIQSRERQCFEEWLDSEEKRMAQGLRPQDEWSEEGFAQLRDDLGRLFDGDEGSSHSEQHSFELWRRR